jgi:hypothetical protein
VIGSIHSVVSAPLGATTDVLFELYFVFACELVKSEDVARVPMQNASRTLLKEQNQRQHFEQSTTSSFVSPRLTQKGMLDG